MRVLFHFGGVWSSAEVWLNGKFLGRHDSGYTSFAFDVSGKLKTGGANLFRRCGLIQEYRLLVGSVSC
ncbi:sugar-binding domain-containing protein [Bacteroides congonensis]|uniref:sugar-binding domain-containing protein n=1 Tax=Bacteroides congonensis TaxID=1871006 RepID=UPI002676D751|nr:sugar-binding domain-containing protein [Bacteroides congonensis]